MSGGLDALAGESGAERLLAVDLGNSSVSLAAVAGRDVRRRWRIGGGRGRDSAGWRRQLDQLSGFARNFNHCLVGSVAPSQKDPLVHALARFCASVTVLETPLLPGVRARVREPEKVGIDRVLNCLACAELHGAPAIVVDIGTATSVDFVTAEGDYGGGLIAPGPDASLAALSTAAELLPAVDFAKPARVLGLDTASCMRSGSYWGFVGMIRELIIRLRGEVGPVETVVATGGYGAALTGDIAELDVVDPELTLRGIALVAERLGL